MNVITFDLETLHSTLFILVPVTCQEVSICQLPLHSTLFILVPCQVCSLKGVCLTLHSTLFILVPEEPVLFLCKEITLHSTLFILVHRPATAPAPTSNLYIPLCLYQYKLISGTLDIQTVSTFHSVYISTLVRHFIHLLSITSTFHSVYISTSRKVQTITRRDPLHSTLFILVLNSSLVICAIFPALHSTLFILVRGLRKDSRIKQKTLHSTLFILVPQPTIPQPYAYSLYIPLCLYQYLFCKTA